MLFRLEDDEAARHHFELVLGDDPPDTVHKKIQEFLTAIHNRRRAKFKFGFSLVPDSNIKSATDSRRLNLSGLEFNLWNLTLLAQTALQAIRAKILVQPFGVSEGSDSAEPAGDQQIVETNTEAISNYLKELVSFSQIPEAIASALAAEAPVTPIDPRFSG